MKIKGLTDEDFVNYKKPSMFIIFPFCSFKCEKESGVMCCQNSSLAHAKIIDISEEKLILRYLDNPITKAIVCGGLEPMDSFDELCGFIKSLRVDYKCLDDIVIYTGFNKAEIEDKIQILKQYPNIIIKYGRFIPNQESHKDDVLGIELASPNQYAEELSC